MARSTLEALLVGASVNGLRFGPLQLIFEPEKNASGEPYVNLASAWTLYADRPESFPENESALPELTEDREILAAVSLRHKVVASVEILTPWPHLLLTFADGVVLYVNGKNDRYESWTSGLAHVPAGKETQVIACPGGDVAFILPEHER